MNLHAKLLQRQARHGPIRVGVIGAGKFGAMFLAQLRGLAGMHLFGLADLSGARAEAALAETGWDIGDVRAASFDEARRTGGTCVTEDAAELIAAGGLDVVVEATGDPVAGVRHALLAGEAGRHLVMVNVEADVLAGPVLADRVERQGGVYSMAYGDQPALVCEMIDWARICGFRVTAAGKGTKYLPAFTASTPDTVWGHYGLSPEEAAAAGMNPQMFNSFIDGTKSAIEMAAISNAAGLAAPAEGLAFPPVGVHDLPEILKPRAAGGILEHAGMVEVVSSVERDGRHVAGDLRWGVYVTFEAGEDGGPGAEYVQRCFRDYGVTTDRSGRFACIYRPSHLIGLELGVSVASAALRGEPTGRPATLASDVVAVAKKDLAPGETLDGEGGYTVRGRLARAGDSLAAGALPIGLANRVRVARAVPAGRDLGWADVEMAESEAVAVRRETEQRFAAGGGGR